MRKLIEDGHVHVARPPLFKVEQKKHARYVQTLGEMARELMDRGLEGTKLLLLSEAKGGAPRELAGDALKQAVTVLDELEDALVILERRGHNIGTLVGRMKDGKLPTFRVMLGNHEHWLFGREEVDALREAELKKGRQLVVADGTTPTEGSGDAEIFSSQELHEAKTVNRILEKLKAFQLGAADLVPPARVAGREPPQRYALESDGVKKVLTTLRELVAEIRKLGERGMKVTRFKGLGEMDGKELWDTTLDPERRTLLRVQLDDALQADEMFRVLMGEKVEPRRDFIQKHALEVKDIDYHGA
jgi:DNA gyrase subunit B